MTKAKDIDLNTSKGRQRFYQSSTWKGLRTLVLRKNPFCIMCLKDGIFNLANEVDHIIDIVDDKSKFMDINNLQALCKSCHSRKTANRVNKNKTLTEINKKWKI